MSTLPRYFKAEDGSTRTVIAVAVKKSDIAMGTDNTPRTILYARLIPQEAPEAFIEFIEQELFTMHDDPAEGVLKYAFAWPLKRKVYELKVAASDGPEGKMATYSQTLTLPDYKTGNLSLSSITLARKAEPVTDAAPAGEDNYRVGALRLIPCVKPVLTAGKDELNFFYDIYNAKPDPASNKPSMDVTYSFEQRTPSGWKKRGRLVEPDKHEETLGYTIPADVLVQWPAADFRLTVQVKDKIANVETSGTVEFTIIK